ncbi:MAG: hypothetical protein COX29_03675 [Candidatus Moranbacteria bacterium CG23_combo_of_CG06-09_8_20_14_all_35_22]|nr:MAG: hypothetical protein COX29_03675 [Candidatus Moranbacteria bacterium CG23_combo_of_CG06-09_8_20_14_all_35_22]
MELSIIITSYKNPQLLKVCLDSIRENYSGADYEIIVADSETEENTEMMMREEYSEIIFIPAKENIGFSGTVNAGYKKVKGDFVLILNGDTIIKKDSIEKLLNYLKNNPKVGIVGPRLIGFNEKSQDSCFRYYTPLTILYRRTFLGKLGFAKKHSDNFLMRDYDHKETKEVDWIQGSVMMTKKEIMDKVGPMDEKFKLYFEDVDWCRRFWEKDYKVIYFPDAQIYHYHGRGSVGKNVIQALLFNRLAWLHIKSAMRYFWKYWGKPLPKHN